MSDSPAPIRCVVVPLAVIEDTLRSMRDIGAHGCELLVLWLGEVDDRQGVASVRTAFVPKQKPITGEDGVGYFITGETLFHLNRGLAETGLRLIAQVHSHPTAAFHSEADDRYAIVTAHGGLSLVVPDFGHARPDPASWAVYRLDKQNWRELASTEVRLLFAIRDR
jgi:Prokaryotic homologs of the JAB domain